MKFEENKNNIERCDWKFQCVVEKFEVGIEEINYDAAETSEISSQSKKFDAIVKMLRRPFIFLALYM